MAQYLRGHGGQVRALLAGVDGRIYSGSFKTRAIVWDGQIASQITRHHAGAVTAVLKLNDGRFASADQDGLVAIWGVGAKPVQLEVWHEMSVAALASWADGLVFAGWEGLIALWSGTGAPTYIDAADGFRAFRVQPKRLYTWQPCARTTRAIGHRAPVHFLETVTPLWPQGQQKQEKDYG